jgi:bacteriorhodopsin
MGYFAMAADFGWVAVEVEFPRNDWRTISSNNPTRQVFWIRYISWYVEIQRETYNR